ncbi:hypothetical protein Taro_001914 [Colocasia esculenta]|uniref:Uncharacterized protein n=1 Tax=Colocasia esculenta TaxID=4460 RepID=A0A843TF18_COLES|nr:hypothetical protein [Colocasia esculenta]
MRLRSWRGGDGGKRGRDGGRHDVDDRNRWRPGCRRSRRQQQAVGMSMVVAIAGSDDGDCNRLPRRWQQASPATEQDTHSTEASGAGVAMSTFSCSVDQEQWKKAIQIWTLTDWKKHSEINKRNKSLYKYYYCAGTKSFTDIRLEEFKINGSTLDREDLFLKTRVKKNGLPVNEDTAAVIENFQNVKLTKLSSSKSSFSSINDAYEQVFGKDRPGRVRGVGIGPTPKNMWGSKEEALREQNLMLYNTLTDMQDRLKKLECISNESKQVDYVAGLKKCVQPSTSAFEPKTKMISMRRRKVKLCDMYRRAVAGGIFMAEEKSKIVMGKKLGEEYLEISVLIAYDPYAPLFAHLEVRLNLK